MLGTSGSESLSACGNVFVGQTEAPLLVKPFLDKMTMSELHAIMVGGFATIAGGVFALYVSFGVDAGHLMVGSVMAVPAGLICTKMLWPETEQSQTMGHRVARSRRSPYGNVVEAAAGGAGDGLKLALNVGAMLIAFLGLVAVLQQAALGLDQQRTGRVEGALGDHLLAGGCGDGRPVAGDPDPRRTARHQDRGDRTGRLRQARPNDRAGTGQSRRARR